MAQGDSASSIVSVAGGATATVQPATGVNWKVESAGRASGTSSQVRLTDGTNTVLASAGHTFQFEDFAGAFGATMTAEFDSANNERESHIQLPNQWVDDTYFVQFNNNACASRTYFVSAVEVK